MGGAAGGGAVLTSTVGGGCPGTCSTSTFTSPGVVIVVVDGAGTTTRVSVVVPGTTGVVNFVSAGGCGFTSMSMSPCAVGGATGSACPGTSPGEALCAWATPHPNTSAIMLIAATIPLFMPPPLSFEATHHDGPREPETPQVIRRSSLS